MFGYYDTAYLNGIVDESSAPVVTPFLDMFFPEVLNHDTEEVHIDKATDKPRITPFVHPLLPGKVIDSKGYSTKSVRPAYIKDVRLHTPQKALKRRVGEGLGGTLTPLQRQQLNIVADIQDQRAMALRRMEVMAVEAVRDGKCTVVGEGFSDQVDFGRDALLDETLLGNDRWSVVDANAPNIPEQLEDWSQEIADFDGNSEALFMDGLSWRLFKRNPYVKEQLDKNTIGTDSSLIIAPQTAIQAGLQYKSKLGSFPIYVYTGTYIDPADGQVKKYMPDYTVVLAGRRLEGVRHFGAIMDVEVLVSRDVYMQSWVEKNPSRRMLSLESAPLLVPYRPNSSKKVKVA